MIDIQKEEAT